MFERTFGFSVNGISLPRLEEFLVPQRKSAVIMARSSCAELRRISANVAREIAEFLSIPQRLIPRVTETDIQWFNIGASRWSSPIHYEKAIAFNRFTSFLTLDSQRVFAGDASTACGKSYLLRVDSADQITQDEEQLCDESICYVKELPMKLLPNFAAGRVYDGGRVYEFGGNGNTGLCMRVRQFFKGKIQKKPITPRR